MPSFLLNIISRFNQPFPEKNSFKKVILTGFFVGLFITSFLYFFRPFGFGKLKHGPELIALIFGLITFATIVVFNFFTSFLLKINKDTDEWTLWKWIVETLILIFVISIGNYFYVLYLINDTVTLSGFLNMSFSTFVVGIFPMVFSGFLIQINALKKHQKQADALVIANAQENREIKPIRLYSQSRDQHVEFQIQDLLYIESKSNYVSIQLQQNGEITSETLRNTMKNIQSQLTSDSAFRCHRSFMVNPEKVINVTGNAQGLRLSLAGLAELNIPVSRSYIPEVKKRLSST